MGEFIFALVVIWVAWMIWQGYQDEQKPPLPLRDGGNGVMEPVCPACHARLVTVTQKTSSGLASVFVVLFGLSGAVLILFHWIAGAIVLILAILISLAGKGQRTVLKCPVCGVTAKTLS